MKKINLLLTVPRGASHADTDESGRVQKHCPRWRKLLPLMVAVLLLAPLSLWAQYNGGTGTSSNPYQIATKAQLDYFRTDVANGNVSGKYYKLTANISYNSNPFTSIGTVNRPFNGNFDGGGSQSADL